MIRKGRNMIRMTLIFQNKESFTVPSVWVTCARTQYTSKYHRIIIECNPEYASVMEQDSVIMSHNQSHTHGTLIFDDVIYKVHSYADFFHTDTIPTNSVRC